MTWFGKAEAKRDKITDAMEGFWGKDTAPVIGIQTQTNDMAQTYENTGDSIKDTVENTVNQSALGQDDVRGVAQYSGAISMGAMQQKPKNPFDIGGFDDMIQKQMVKERGAFGGSLMGGSRGVDPRLNQLADFRFNAMKRNMADEMKYKRLAMIDIARQSQSKRELAKETVRNYKEAANRQRIMSGLPVYESGWDVIAGGKRAVPKYKQLPKYDKEGNITGYESVKVGEELQRYGGLFGATRETTEILGRGAGRLGKVIQQGAGFFEKGLDKGIDALQKEGGPIVDDFGRKFTTKANDFKETVLNPSGKFVDEAMFDYERGSTLKNPKPDEDKKYSGEYMGDIPRKYDKNTESSVNDAMKDMFG